MLKRGAVFDAAAGIEIFGFAVNLDVFEVRVMMAEAKQRRVADVIENRRSRRHPAFQMGGGVAGVQLRGASIVRRYS